MVIGVSWDKVVSRRALGRLLTLGQVVRFLVQGNQGYGADKSPKSTHQRANRPTAAY